MIEIENLWKLIDEHVMPAHASELALSDALGCVAAREVLSPVDSPAFDHSSMDGYAFTEVDPAAPCRVVREIPAGSTEPGSLGRGEAARIFTELHFQTEPPVSRVRKTVSSRALMSGCGTVCISS